MATDDPKAPYERRRRAEPRTAAERARYEAEDRRERQREALEEEEGTPGDFLQMARKLGRRLVTSQIHVLHRVNETHAEMRRKAMLRAFQGDEERFLVAEERAQRAQVKARENFHRALAHGFDYCAGQLDVLTGLLDGVLDRMYQGARVQDGLAGLVEQMQRMDPGERAQEEGKWFLRYQLAKDLFQQDLPEFEWRQLVSWALGVSTEMPAFVRSFMGQMAGAGTAPSAAEAPPLQREGRVEETLTPLAFVPDVLFRGSAIEARLELQNRSSQDRELDFYVGACVARPHPLWNVLMREPWPDARCQLADAEVEIIDTSDDWERHADERELPRHPTLLQQFGTTRVVVRIHWSSWFDAVLERIRQQMVAFIVRHKRRLATLLRELTQDGQFLPMPLFSVNEPKNERWIRLPACLRSDGKPHAVKLVIQSERTPSIGHDERHDPSWELKLEEAPEGQVVVDPERFLACLDRRVNPPCDPDGSANAAPEPAFHWEDHDWRAAKETIKAIEEKVEKLRRSELAAGIEWIQDLLGATRVQLDAVQERLMVIRPSDDLKLPEDVAVLELQQQRDKLRGDWGALEDFLWRLRGRLRALDERAGVSPDESLGSDLDASVQRWIELQRLVGALVVFHELAESESKSKPPRFQQFHLLIRVPTLGQVLEADFKVEQAAFREDPLKGKWRKGAPSPGRDPGQASTGVKREAVA